MATKKCHECGSGRLVEATRERREQVDGRIYLAEQPVERCDDCGVVTTDGSWLHAFELQLARELASTGPRSGAGFQFMRKAIGLKADELAALLDVTRETISRWENDRQPLERRALVVLGDLVVDHIACSRRTLDRIEILRRPPKLAKTVRIDIAPDVIAATRN